LSSRRSQFDPVVITGIGLIASVGNDRESVWRAVREGRSSMRRLSGLPGIPDGMLIGAPVDIRSPVDDQLKCLRCATRVAEEAMRDAGIRLGAIRPERFGCSIKRSHGRRSFASARVGHGPFVSAHDDSLVGAMAAKLGLLAHRQSLSPARAANVAFHGVRQRLDRNTLRDARHSRWPVRHRLGRKRRGHRFAVRRRLPPNASISAPRRSTPGVPPLST